MLRIKYLTSLLAHVKHHKNNVFLLFHCHKL
nr:MAG TPA: hypothetical protein [Caudoviricetes sp.]